MAAAATEVAALGSGEAVEAHITAAEAAAITVGTTAAAVAAPRTSS